MSIIHADHPDPDAIIEYSDHPECVIDVYGSDSAPGVVIYLHGGYWRPRVDRTHARTASRALSDLGLQCFSVEYRRVPGDPDLMLSDVHQALNLLLPLIGNRPTTVVGHSAGGWLALLLAENLQDIPSLRRLVLLAPVTDLARTRHEGLGDGAVAEMFHDPELDTTRYAPPREIGIPAVVIHGTHDSRVRHDMSEEYADLIGATLVTYPEVGHFSLIDPAHHTWPTTSSYIDPRT